jgi:hypothetical protein
MMPGETVESGANNGKYGTNGYSELKVMQSPAGWYLGTTFNGGDFDEPGSRETHYLGSRGTADHTLEMWSHGHRPYKRT